MTLLHDRQTWDQYFKQLVEITSTRSSCERLHVGCMFIKDNRIVAQGYNGYIAGCEHKMVMRDNHNIGTIHAEQNAISDCAKRGVSCLGCDAYITHYPCVICARILLASGIVNIKYIDDYKNDDLVEYFCNMKNVKITKL